MDIVDEIREIFATQINGFRLITGIDSKYIAYAIRLDGFFGVAIPFDRDVIVAEHFSGAELHTRARVLGDSGVEKTFLELTCIYNDLRNEFASLCAQFVAPGEHGCERARIIEDPLSWWNNWRKLLGNRSSEKKAYSVIAELEALYVTFLKDRNVKWAAADHTGTQDIETSKISVEVKSTLEKTGTDVTISSLNQLKTDPDHEMYLYFCRLEKSEQGLCINDCVLKLLLAGYDEYLLEHELEDQGYEKGCSARDERFRITEKRKYFIDEEFPSITVHSFKNNELPPHLKSMTYTLDLSDYPFTEW